MASTKKYALERGGPKRLAIKRRWLWKNTEVSLDGAPLGPPIRNLDALKAGQPYTLPDGRTLVVGFEKQLAAAGVTATVDGRPVPGAFNDPRVTIRTAAKLLWFLAGLNLVLAAVILSLAGVLRDLGLGMAIFGVVLAGLGAAAYFWHSRLAIAAAIVIEIFDVIAVVGLMPTGRTPPVGAIILRVFIVVALVRAYQAVERARRLDRDETIDRAFS